MLKPTELFKKVSTLHVVSTHYEGEPVRWAFDKLYENAWCLSLGKRQLHISFLSQWEQEARKEERNGQRYEKSFIGFKRVPGYYFIKIGRREFGFCPNAWPKKSNLEKRMGKPRPWVGTTHTLPSLNTEFFVGRHGLIVSTMR